VADLASTIAGTAFACVALLAAIYPVVMSIANSKAMAKFREADYVWPIAITSVVTILVLLLSFCSAIVMFTLDGALSGPALTVPVALVFCGMGLTVVSLLPVAGLVIRSH
jgi:hydrogenase-4 membrane subunit HyfE